MSLTIRMIVEEKIRVRARSAVRFRTRRGKMVRFRVFEAVKEIIKIKKNYGKTTIFKRRINASTVS